ncbi:minor capsid protein [Lactiplantibacillus sp. WILCCON 0030]|uniref:Minor capsid protein n=1 Tax=Lactiplantibacillus brownii TaxID=3069269 RepID=A0ABU1A7Y6_9LACO|nr:minor capsid protein [Lactiplantibacillus brownii]MDQ7937062.1 minor capsid protein [Lactiplantibacillus brownii]
MKIIETIKKMLWGHPHKNTLSQNLSDTKSESEKSVNPLVSLGDTDIDKKLLVPLESDILPGDIILMMWSNNKSINALPPLYFKYEFGIDPTTHRKKLISTGYLEKGSPSESLKSLLVPQLKEILRENKLPVSGRKQELITRIESQLKPEQYADKILDTYLVASPHGQALLNKYRNLTWAHKHNSKDGIINVPNAIGTTITELQQKLKSSRSSSNISKEMFIELKECESDAYQISATLDKKTCPKCGEMDQKIFQTSRVKFGMNFPPFHDGCRCTVDPYIAGLPDLKERWMRNPKTGKGEIVSNIDYTGWRKNMVQKYGKEIFDR